MKREDDSILNIKIKRRPVRMDKFVKYISSFVKVKTKGINLTFVDKKEIIHFWKYLYHTSNICSCMNFRSDKFKLASNLKIVLLYTLWLSAFYLRIEDFNIITDSIR